MAGRAPTVAPEGREPVAPRGGDGQSIATVLAHEPRVFFAHEVRPAEHRGPQQACHPDALEICLVEHGFEHARLGRVVSPFCAGQYGLIAPGVVHSSWTTTRSVRESIAHIDVELIEEIGAEVRRGHRREWPSGMFVAPEEMLGLIRLFRHELAAETSSGPGHRLLVGSFATALVVQLLRHHQGAAAPRLADAASRGLQDAEEMIRAAPGEAITLETLAALAGMSRFHFVRSFKKRYGLPPHAYLLRLRLERAVELIRTTELPLTAIAFEVGFSSSSRLTEAFRRAHGGSPSEWRRRMAAAIPGSPRSKIRVVAQGGPGDSGRHPEEPPR